MLPIYSIGHGARKIEDFIVLLQQYGIRYLADVRTCPLSKFHPQYNGDTLAASLAKAGIRYVYMGDALGGRPKDEGVYGANGRPDHQLLKARPYFRSGIGRLRKAYEQQLPIAVMCAERDPAFCHRTRLIGASLQEEKIPLVHIDETDKLRTQEEIIQRVNNRKGKLF